MSRFFTLLLGGLSAALLLAGCHRASYSLLPSAPVASQPALVGAPPTRADSLGAVVILRGPSAWPESRIQLVQPTSAVKLFTGLPIALSSKAQRPASTSLTQQLLMRYMVAKMRNRDAASQNNARKQARAEISPAGRAGVLAFIGLVLLIIALASTAHTLDGVVGLLLLGIIGGSLLVSGVVALLIHLVSQL